MRMIFINCLLIIYMKGENSMRINCASVEESKNVETIEKKVKELFPNYSVVVVPKKKVSKKRMKNDVCKIKRK